MTEGQAKRMILLAVLAAGATTAARQIIVDKERPSSRIMVGAFGAGVVLFSVADQNAELAGKFASVLLVSALIANGTPEVWERISNIMERDRYTVDANPATVELDSETGFVAGDTFPRNDDESGGGTF